MEIETHIWPEDPVPEAFRDCIQCELAGQRKRMIWGEGDTAAPLMIILDNPGAREDASGQAFICGTRHTLREAILKAGLDPQNVYITYLLKCRPVRRYNKPDSRAVCSGYLKKQLLEINPRLLVFMGEVVLTTLFSIEANLQIFRGRELNWQGIPAIVTYHPLAARRRPNLFRYLVEDLSKAAVKVKEIIF